MKTENPASVKLKSILLTFFLFISFFFIFSSLIFAQSYGSGEYGGSVYGGSSSGGDNNNSGSSSSSSDDGSDDNTNSDFCDDRQPGENKPQIYRSEKLTSTRVRLYFTSGAGPRDNFEIRYSTNSDDLTHKLIYDVQKDKNTYDLPIDLPYSANKYYFKVRALNGCAAGPYSETVPVTFYNVATSTSQNSAGYNESIMTSTEAPNVEIYGEDSEGIGTSPRGFEGGDSNDLLEESSTDDGSEIPNEISDSDKQQGEETLAQGLDNTTDNSNEQDGENFFQKNSNLLWIIGVIMGAILVGFIVFRFVG